MILNIYIQWRVYMYICVYSKELGNNNLQRVKITDIMGGQSA